MNNFLKGVQILRRVPIKFNIGDVSRVGQSVIGRFKLDLFPSGNFKVDGNVETVCVILAVGNAFNATITLAIDPDEASGQTFSRGCQKREVQPRFS